MEIPGKRPIKCHFVHHKSPLTGLILNTDSRDVRPVTNRLRRGTASRSVKIEVQKYIVLPLIWLVLVCT